MRSITTTWARCACVLLLATACRDAEAPVTWHQENGYRWRELAIRGGEAGFTRVSNGSSGIEFQNSVSDSLLLGNRILGQGGGVALGDVDGDGRVDVFLAKTQGCSALYRNLGNWKFEDITKSAGVGACDRNSTGAVFADVDGDGDLDLILLSTRGPNAIFINDGHGHFTEHRDMGLDSTGQGGATLTLADVDGDGKLDMYVANYRAYNIDDSLPPQRRAINQMVHEIDKTHYEIVPEFRNEYKLVNRPDMGGLRMSQRGAPDAFYHNDGAGHFTKVELSSRFMDATGKPVTGDPESFTLNARFVDLNGDGAPDLYVTNDFEDTDQLWFNDGKGKFHLADWKAQRQMSNSSMGMDVADINGDGLPDFFVDDMLGADSRRRKMEIPTHTAMAKKFGDIETPLQQQRNVLFLNRGDGTFAEIGQYAGVQATGWSWGSLFIDVDLDGYQDLLVANGHLWDIMDADTQEGLQNRLNNFPWQRLRWQFPKYPLKNVAYRNRGDLTFEDVSAKWHFGTEEDISHALAAADLDGDGDLDVVVNRLGAPALLLRNDASAKRVAVRLIGDAPNTQAVGAKITLRGGAVPLQVREVAAGGLYMSHSDYLASFAMGSSDSATLVIDWRDGRRTTLGVRANREYQVTQKTAVSVAPAAATAAHPLFEDATAQLGGHVHAEPQFDDWDRQFLLPNALTTLGPGLAWFDLDRDGSEELLVGTGKGGQIGVFRNRGGHLVRDRAQGPVASADYTGIVGFTEKGASRVLAGVSTWQARTPEEMTQQPAVIGMSVAGGSLAAKVAASVGSHESATGPIALADIDGDGDLDLFVGARAIPLKYPAAASSGLFRNENGKFVFDTANAAVLKDVGLVSAAVFADLNGDGHPDLILAREWGSILVLFNDGHGVFHAAPASYGFARWTSRWNGVTVGDLDGDGRLDIVATSWGRNTSMTADTTHPLFIYHGPFGAKGEEEMLLAHYDARLGAVAPLNSYARVRIAFPDIVSRIPTFAAYADASIEKVMGSASAERLEATTLDNMVFLNRGDHFEARALPRAAQLAPAFYAGIADFDGDGNEDLFLGQNFSATSVGDPRYDAGRGLLLAGDGKGGLTAMSGAQSGIVVYGDMRGAAFADYDGDGRIDLAISQNGGATRLFHNTSAKPGLRVRLAGGPLNPDGIGAQVRLVYGERMGPVREVTAGSGYWSQNGAVQVMGESGTPTEVWVRWAGGAVTRVPVPAGAREVTVRATNQK